MERSDNKEKRTPYLFLLIFFILSAGIIITGYIFYRNYEKHYRTEVERQLSAIAEMKTNGLVDWRKERLAEASVFYKNDDFSAHVRQYLKTPGDSEARTRLRTWIRQFQKAFEYDRVFLLDTKGVERMSAPETPEPVAPHLLEHYSEILRSGQVTLLDFHRDAPDRPIHLSIIVPILDGQEASRPIGLIVLRIDPEKYLYPLIKRWPTPSKTAETLLVRREGNEVLFLNELKFRKNTALNLRVPIEKKETVAVKAVLGRQGFAEGRDYRGHSVIGYVRTIPDSPWFLVARMDISEVYAPLRERLWIMVLLIGALLIGAGAGVGLVWRHQRSRFYQKQAESLEFLRESEEKYRILLENLATAVVVHSPDSAIVYFNAMALSFLGLSEDQMWGKTAMDPQWNFLQEDGSPMPLGDYPVNRVITSGAVIQGQVMGVVHPGCTEPLWVLCNGYPVKDEKGRLVQAVIAFSDITERKHAETEIQQQLAELRRWQAVMLEREDRSMKLKGEVNELARRLGEPVRYPSQEQ